MLRILGIIVILAVIFGMALELRRPIETSEVVEYAKPVPDKRRVVRKPASLSPQERTPVASTAFAPRITERSSPNREPHAPIEPETPSAGAEYNSAPEERSTNSSASRGSSGTSQRAPASKNDNSDKKTTIGGILPQSQDPSHTMVVPGPVNSKPIDDSPPATSPSSGGSSGGTVFTCSGNIGGGAYNHPLDVTLSCNSSATIRYCLAQGHCCDPETSGLTYSSQIVVGAEEGQYCLSFVGEGPQGISNVISLNYTINHSLPDLSVDHQRTMYQTTELAGMSFLTSNDFSKSGYSIGQINLKSHDPGPSGLNLTCVEIMNDYSTFVSPLVSMTLSLYSMFGLMPTQQIEVPLNLNQLEYGNNFITTYVVNQAYSSPLYSCSTTNVVLNDFEFYQTDSHHREIGSGGMQEFSAGFQPYGVLSPDEGMRSPASIPGEADLEVGMIEIFY